MKKEQILESIKLGFKRMLFAGSTTQFTTTDGKTIIAYGEDIMVGCEVYSLNTDNTQSPLENGEYTLQDGRTITVSDNSVTEIKVPEAPASAQSPETNPTNMSEGMPDGQLNSDNMNPDEIKSDGEMESRISALEQTVQEIMTMLQDYLNQSAEMKQEQVKMSENIKKISNEPAGEKVKMGKKMFGQTSTDTTMDEIRSIQKRMFNKV